MLRSQVSDNTWTLSLGGLSFVAHRPDAPFAVALHREKTYESDRGTVKEHVVEAERIPLTDVAEDGESVVLSGGGHSLRAQMVPCDKGVDLILFGEEGWAYCFTLAALEKEAVFGGGEQYRQTDLRGEHVVNFVSEHIKAATILEKALLPRRLYREKPHSAIGSYAPMPVFVTDRGRLFLFDTEADGVSRFLDDSYAFTFDSCPRKLTLLKGESYEELALALAERIPNRQYIPDWCRSGMIAVCYFFSYAVLRFVLEFFRGDHTDRILGMTRAQLTGLFVMIPVGIFCYFYFKKHGEDVNTEPTA